MTYPYEAATEEQRKIGSWWWCVHHKIHLEQLTEPIENRVKYIMGYKPEHERETRLRNLAPVLHPERIPERVRETWAEFNKARAEYAKALAAYDKARAKWDRALADLVKARGECNKTEAEYNRALDEWDRARAEYEPELMALHREEYPDTTWNGSSIFGKEAGR